MFGNQRCGCGLDVGEVMSLMSADIGKFKRKEENVHTDNSSISDDKQTLKEEGGYLLKSQLMLTETCRSVI